MILTIAGLFIFGGFAFLVGGLIGFLLRPEAPFVGQLSFITVITRGANLSGMDAFLVPVAQTSFNYMVAGAFLLGMVGAAVGGTLGFGIGFLLSKRAKLTGVLE